MRPRSLLVVLLVLSLVGASTAALAAARPPPRPLCDGCGDSFAATAAEFGVDIQVTESTATVRVYDNGTAIWTVYNSVTDSPDLARLRENASLRADVADRAMWDTDVLSTSVSDDGVVTVRYREDDFATESFGVLRSGVFTESLGYANMDGLGADELTVVAPDGMRVEATVPGASVPEDGRQMTLTAFAEEDEGLFVTFVPEDATLGSARSTLACWAGKVEAVFESTRFFATSVSLTGVSG